MNYIKEINSLYDKLETNPLSAHAIALWYALMATANKAGWVSKFAVAISTLEAKTSLNKKAIERARNELSQKKYIQWNKRSGNLSAEYSLISLCDKTDSEFVSQDVPQSVSQDVPQSVAITKLNKTKLNNKEINKEKAKRFSSSKSIIEREKEFRSECENFIALYSEDTINAFCSYWTEPTNSGNKMRFELERTWETSRRLKTWYSNESKFNKNTNVSKPQEVAKTLAAEIMSRHGNNE